MIQNTKNNYTNPYIQGSCAFFVAASAITLIALGALSHYGLGFSEISNPLNISMMAAGGAFFLAGGVSLLSNDHHATTLVALAILSAIAIGSTYYFHSTPSIPYAEYSFYSGLGLCSLTGVGWIAFILNHILEAPSRLTQNSHVKPSWLDAKETEWAFALREAPCYLSNLPKQIDSLSRSEEPIGLLNLNGELPSLENLFLEYSPHRLLYRLGFNGTNFKKDLEEVPIRVIQGKALVGESDTDAEVARRMHLFPPQKENFSATYLGPFFDAGAGVSQKYSIGTHTLLVLETFETYFADQKYPTELLSRDEFRLFLALHDIGKGQAVVEEGLFETPLRKKKELEYTRQIIQKVCTQLGISEEKSNIMQALLFDVTLGKYCKGIIDQQVAKAELKLAIQQHCPEINFNHFLDLAIIFHKVDAAAYRALRCRQDIFEITENELNYAKPAATKINSLADHEALQK
jgi:hypothetical protein